MKDQYPYDLGYHLKMGKLCRIPKGRMPAGTVRIIRYREMKCGHISSYILDPYDDNGQLKSCYWSIYRWIDYNGMLNDRGTSKTSIQPQT